MCPVVGLFGYVAVVCVDAALRTSPKGVLKMSLLSCTLGAAFFLINWLFAVMFYGTSFLQMLAGQVQGVLFQRTIFSCYAVTTFGLLCLIHSLVAFVLLPRRVT